MFAFLRLLQYLAPYGSRAVAWAWRYRGLVIDRLSRWSIDRVVMWIVSQL